MKLTDRQAMVVNDLKREHAELHVHTQTFPPYASYQYHGVTMHIQWRTFQALERKGAIYPTRFGTWEAA